MTKSISAKLYLPLLLSGLLGLISLPSLAEERRTVLVVGDSLSAGYGLPLGQGWVEQLEQHLAAARADAAATAYTIDYTIEWVNDSISGDTTAGGLARLPAMLEYAKPDWVIIALGANDGLRGGRLDEMQDNLEKMIDLVKRAAAKPILFGIRLPPNYGPDYVKKFVQVYPAVAARTETPLLAYFLDGVGGMPHLNQADGLHPNAAGHAIIKDTVWRFLQTVLPPVLPDSAPTD